MHSSSTPGRLFGALMLSLVASVSLCGCRNSSTQAGASETTGKPEERPAQAYQDAASEEKSDLDMPLDEILAASCEHGILTYQCAECRYEVGMVRVPQNLLAGGLIKTVEVASGAGDATLALTGEIAVNELKASRLSPMVPGIVTRVLVDFGQRVAAGQGLISVRSVDLAEAEAEYLEAESKMRLSQKTYERQKGLRAAGITAERELLEAEEDLASARIRTEAAHQKLVRLGFSDRDIQALVSQGMRGASGELVLRAPFAGTVLELHAVAGELLNPGDTAALVADLSQLWLWADIYERDLPRVLDLKKKGEVRTVGTVQAYPGEEFSGRIDYVASVMDEKSRTVKIRINLANPDGRLRPGMFATVNLELPGRQETLSVPSSAILSNEGRDFVFVHRDGNYFLRRPIVRGIEQNGRTEVMLGLDAGQTVVADGAFLLKSDVLRSKMGAGCAD